MAPKLKKKLRVIQINVVLKVKKKGGNFKLKWCKKRKMAGNSKKKKKKKLRINSKGKKRKFQ